MCTYTLASIFDAVGRWTNALPMETCPIFENKTINGTKKQGTMVNVKRLTSTPSKTFTQKKESLIRICIQQLCVDRYLVIVIA